MRTDNRFRFGDLSDDQIAVEILDDFGLQKSLDEEILGLGEPAHGCVGDYEDDEESECDDVTAW